MSNNSVVNVLFIMLFITKMCYLLPKNKQTNKQAYKLLKCKYLVHLEANMPYFKCSQHTCDEWLWCVLILFFFHGTQKQ